MTLDDRTDRLLNRTFIDFQPTETFMELPVVMNRAKGLYYWDVHGKRYFDAIGGVFVATLGHSHPRVMETLRQQMDRLCLAPPLHSISDVALDLIEKIGSVTPGNLNFVKPFSGGSESVESALKFARQYWRQSGHPGKYKFVSRYQGYHGSTFGALSAGGTGARKTPYGPELSGFVKVFPPTHYRDQFDSWEECNRFCARMFEDVIIHEDPKSVAGVIVEPIGNTGGIITPTEEYFQILREICDRHDVLLIFDEIITGYGKTGAMFAAQSFGVTPDIICAGKGLSSGAIPLGAMIAREDMAKAFSGPPEDERYFAHGNTFAGHALACSAGIAVLDEIIDKRLDETARELGDYLTSKLETLKKHGVVREVRGRGVIRGVELTKNPDTLEPFPELGKALKTTAIENGLILRVDPNWFAVCPALIAEKADIDELCDLIEKSLLDALNRV